jgi:hypothetical protein
MPEIDINGIVATIGIWLPILCTILSYSADICKRQIPKENSIGKIATEVNNSNKMVQICS